MNDSTTPVLELHDVSVDLGARPVLREVSVAVRPGELVALLGPNGAGKTTLLRAALGLVPLRSGCVRIDGAPGRHGTLGYVPQRHEFAWDYPISVEQVVMTGRTPSLGLWRRPAVADWAGVRQALERVELAELSQRPVGQLSGGQRQRVLVARALAAGARVLLLDEPFTGLDLPTQELLTRLFARLVGEGCSLLMATHDLAAAVTTCDRLVLLDGRVVAEGPPATLTDPAPWRRTFGVAPDSVLLAMVGVRS
jgi:manganese/iron transport system ATP-binding protein